MLEDVAKPIRKQIQILDIEFSELSVEKYVHATGKSAKYFIYIRLAKKALAYAVELLEKAEMELKKGLQ